MAIEINCTANDVSINNCYVRVSSIGGNKHRIVAVVSYNANSESESFSTSQVDFIPTLDGINLFAQAYAHLKTLPEFAGAIDC